MSNDEQQEQFVGVREGAVATYLAESKPSRNSRESGNPVWKVVQLGDIAEAIQYGHTASAIQSSDGPRFLRITDIQDGHVDWRSVPTCDIPKSDVSRYRLNTGDIVFARTGATTGKSFLISNCPEAVFASYLIRVRLKAEVVPDFIYLFFQSPAYWRQIEAGKRGIGQPNVNGSVLSQVQIPLPPLDEQRRIVAELETQLTRLDASVTALKRVQANLKRYRASVLKAACEGRLVPTEAELARKEGRSYQTAHELLGTVLKGATPKAKRRAGRLWGSGHVPELTDQEKGALPTGWQMAKVSGLGFSVDDAVQVGPMSMKSSDFVEGGVPVLNMGCVKWGRFDESKLDHLPSNKAEAFERYRVMPGDVLFTRSGTVGRCAVAQPHQRNWLMTFHLLRARPDPDRCLPEFLRTVFEGAAHIRRQTREASIGSTRAGFNTNLLAALDVPVPPMAEQKRIVAEVERRLSVIEELEATVAANLKRAERLRQSVLAGAFSS